ncbi:SigE family RNA polymerase sigma factor [Actinoplanes friuliensis]|jgi:RNA polymerase sigma-70 factor (sigma-E family)|uniref:Putative RNA polymerase ECF-subfamily sigma factor n=1 Tax=Actinoplanes friuliensis DSM 7358 TaxID=1246995 RepID=U5W102_9ACTN|nr:SigE family RNA polymerase sigma factor [Actinoplanes friuliensis]AGZ41566.1 putative RNA polymerase ECF-subfamily sigma factor [Actinoplanes friuliensis DSM 7358]
MKKSDADYVAYVQGRLPALRRLAYHLAGDSHHADDLVQETIAKLYAVWGRISGSDGLDAYTRTMLVRAFLDEKRRGWWRVRLFDAVPESAGQPPPGVEERLLLVAALKRVPPKQQATLVLRFLHDLPIAEVATILGCSEGTVKSQTTHGLATLRRLLTKWSSPSATAVR